MEPFGAALFGDPCRDCGYVWTLTPEDLIAGLGKYPARMAALLDGRSGAERHPDLEWSAVAYVCHVADNLRNWAERVNGARLSGDPLISAYDPDLLSKARRYDAIHLAGALWSLQRSVDMWTEVMSVAHEQDIELLHDKRGPQRPSDIIRNNTHDAAHHYWDVERILAQSF